MVKHSFLFFTFVTVSFLCTRISARSLQPMQCNATFLTPTCNSYLYVIPNGRTLASVASDFSANAAFMQPINRQSGAQDLVVQVPCVCEALGSDSTAAFFHDVNYTVKPGDAPRYVSDKIFSGLAWNFGDGNVLISGKRIVVHLPCGCSSTAPEGVLSYAVQDGDVLSKITTLFRSNREAIVSLNPSLISSEFLEPGWVLLIPLGVDGQVHGSSKKGAKNGQEGKDWRWL